jgi:hypothetical protein
MAVLASSLALAGAGPVGAAAPLTLHYEVSASGIEVLTIDFRVTENGGGYDLAGFIRTAGVLRLVSSYSMRLESRGAIAAEELRPRLHEMASGTRGRAERSQHLDYTADGAIRAELRPPEDPDKPAPTAEQIVGTVDPLTALLRVSHVIARTGRCAARIAVYDGRRRYDMVLSDDGSERLGPSAGYAYAGMVQRCTGDIIKIAGFSFDRDYMPHANHGQVWMAAPRPGSPPLPIRLDFSSDFGTVSVRLARIEPAQ